MKNKRLFFHVDLDAFYAAVEVLDHPQYKGKPIVVGGKGRRAVVSTSSYEARALGVHSAMPMYEAKRKVPFAIFLDCRMARYKEISEQVMSILKNFTPNFQQISIDEAFLDVSGMERLFGEIQVQAKNIKDQVLKKTGLTVSIGGASNKYIAKIASSLSKPDGLLIVENGCEEEFMKSIPLKKMWGVGKKLLEKLEKAGIKTVPHLLEFSEGALQNMFGNSTGSFLYSAARGGSSNIFKERKEAKSISCEHTFEFDEKDLSKIDDLLFELSDRIAKQLIDKKLMASSILIKICYCDFLKVQHSQKIEETSDTQSIYKYAKEMFKKKYNTTKAIRLLGLGVSLLKKEEQASQGNLFDAKDLSKKTKAERTMRALQKKYGCISPLRLLKRKDE